MKIVADQQIPWLDALWSPHAELLQLPSEAINSSILIDADVLLIRSITQVNQALLEHSALQWIGSAASGTDHIDFNRTKLHNITVANAPGANADAVLQYVQGCVCTLNKELIGRRAAVIGVGRIGQRVADWLTQQGFTVVCYDPPRAEREAEFVSCDWNMVTQCDLICCHTPLTRKGTWPTYHLFNSERLSQIKAGAVVLNAGRGDLFEERALLDHSSRLQLVLDVWPNEPEINLGLLKQCQISTPHIAGYAASAKYRASLMLYQAAQAHFAWQRDIMPWVNKVETLEKKLLSQAYDPIQDSDTMKEAFFPLITATTTESKNKHTDIRDCFRKLRNHYVLR